MTLFLYVLKLLAFFISSVGYWELLSQTTSINLFYYPVLTISLQINVLFLAGLLNCLHQATFLLYGFGIACFIFYRMKKGSTNLKSLLLNRGYIFLFVGAVMIACITHGQLFSHYDNFSHWAMITKAMFRTNSYPSFATPTVMFQAYPPGTATFIYYFCMLTNTAESTQMLAQNIISLSCFLPLFQHCRSKTHLDTLFIYLLANYVLVYCIFITELLVDTVLPLVGVCGLLFTYNECVYSEKSSSSGDHGLSFLFAASLSTTAILIKNSGIFFAVFISSFITYSIFNTRYEFLGTKIAALTLPFVALFLWQAHCAYVFPQASLSKHAMSLSNYAQGIHSKTSTVNLSICKEMFHLTFSGNDVLILFVFCVILGFVVYHFYHERFRFYICFCTALICLYLLYMMGMLAMYIFSMPIPEAVKLAGSIRYKCSIIITILLLLSAYTLWLANLSPSKKIYYLQLAILCSTLMFLWGGTAGYANVFQVLRFKDRRPTRARLEKVISNNHIQQGKSYAVLLSKNDGGYTYYMSRYLLDSINVKALKINNVSDFKGIENYEYIINFDADNRIIQLWHRDKFKRAPNRHYILAQ